ncbi:MAG TPA: alcohol dehydrogenase catalytic domain-containing protein [Candidatus Nanopelagicaceae bacterium]|nr:alcohol dehydrogenase catalytic domain-containing protein [Candidatus Nanopelagicaceae bacterium]
MEKMLAAVFHKGDELGGDIKLEEVDIPNITKSNQVLVEIKACGICGTDLKIIEGGHPANDNTILGHEFAGIVREVGESVQDLKVGDKVVADPNEKCGYCINCRRGLSNLCEYMAQGTTFGIFQNGGFAKFCVLPRSSLFKLPEKIDLVAASLIEPLSCAVHCHNIANVKESDNVVIIGAGPMGLIIESVIRKHPIKKLISVEIDEWRGQKALELGANLLINPDTTNVQKEIMKFTNNEGADVIIDAVGISKTFEMATEIWAPGARLVCFGQDYRAEAKIKPNDIVRYQRQILGSYIGYAEDFLDAIELVANKTIDIDKLITKVIPLEKLILTGFKLMKERKCIKIITLP